MKAGERTGNCKMYKFEIGSSYGVDGIVIGILNRELINKNKVYHATAKTNNRWIRLFFITEEALELTIGLGKQYFNSNFIMNKEQYEKDLFKYNGQIVYVPLQYLIGGK